MLCDYKPSDLTTGSHLITISSIKQIILSWYNNCSNLWRILIKTLPYCYVCNQQDANIQVNLLFLVSSTCFGRCFRPSSGTLDCIYSIWLYSPKLLPAGVLGELKPNSPKTPAGSNLGEYYQIL